MPAPIIPWLPSNIPIEIQNEMNRRKVNRSFSFVNNTKAGWDKADGDWKKYRGPMTAWVRMCSNGAGHPAVQKQRFVLHGGKDFYNSYGYQTNKSSSTGFSQIIGYTPTGEPHIIESGKSVNYPTGVPNPEITRVEVLIQKELYRRATVEWICFSWEQLQYMTPYFLIPRITVMLEWGWNHFNPASLVKIEDKDEMIQLFKNPYPLYKDNILRSNGNYDVIYGFITNFNWSVDGNKIIVSTEITSKDRLYAGIASDSSLNSKASDTEDDGILQSIKQFVDASGTFNNIKELSRTSTADFAAFAARGTQAQALREIVQNLMDEQKKAAAIKADKNVTAAEIYQEIVDMRRGYLAGVFAGREMNNQEAIKYLGEPSKYDFDSGKSSDEKTTWINMGLVVELLNHFSKRKGVAGDPMFEVEIYYSVITGHPNLISCDPRVLIPNYQAPKYHWGIVGQQIVEDATAKESGIFSAKNSKDNDYYKQDRTPKQATTEADKKIMRIFMQGRPNCYRNNIEWIINVNRYHTLGIKPQDTTDFSFPSSKDDILKNGQIIKKDYSGLLSNIYIQYESFKNIIKDPNNKTYIDIYNAIFKMLTEATDNLWDLTLVESQTGKLTIVDRNYPAGVNFKTPGAVWDFSFYDSDSIIKSLRFRPQLSDAQATRTIYADTNNKKSGVSYSDRNDLLNYKFEDAIILPTEEKKDATIDKTRRDEMVKQFKDTLRTLQVVNNKDSACLQMSVKPKNSTTKDGVPIQYEIVKLILPPSAQSLLRMILDDGDFQNNPRYCAIQPGITVELTLEGIGGLRTFQYFRIRNLPEPYSHKNIIFRIIEVTQSISGGQWETVIKAGILPLRKFIADQLGITDVDFSKDLDQSAKKS